MGAIILEVPGELRAVHEEEDADAMLAVLFEVAFVLLPAVAEGVEILVGELVIYARHIIIDDALPVEPLLLPAAKVGDVACLVVQGSGTVDLSLLPLAVVDAAVLVEELAEAVTFAVDLLAFVAGASLIVLLDKIVLTLNLSLNRNFLSWSCLLNRSFFNRG